MTFQSRRSWKKEQLFLILKNFASFFLLFIRIICNLIPSIFALWICTHIDLFLPLQVEDTLYCVTDGKLQLKKRKRPNKRIRTIGCRETTSKKRSAFAIKGTVSNWLLQVAFQITRERTPSIRRKLAENWTRIYISILKMITRMLVFFSPLLSFLRFALLQLQKAASPLPFSCISKSFIHSITSKQNWRMLVFLYFLYDIVP